jgi:predicted phage-related endonuclease
MITKEQKKIRLKGCGGSDIHNLICEPPYGCDRKLHYDKTDQEPDFPFIVTPAINRGNALEQMVCDMYAERTGRKLKKINLTLFNRNHPKAVGHVDRAIVGDDRGMGVFEAKTVGMWMDKKIQEEGLPNGYIYQLQWYMQDGWYYLDKNGKEVSVNFKWGAYGLLSIENWEIIEFDIEKDEDMIQSLRDLNNNFWGNIKDNIMPDRLNPSDKRCKTCMYRTTCQGEHLLDTVQYNGLEKDDSLSGLFNEYGDIKQIMNDGSVMLKKIRDKIMIALGDRAEVQSSNFIATYKPMISRRLNTKLLKQEKPEIYQDYVAESVSRPLKIKTIGE